MESFRPDVAILDLNMPGMDGVEFLRHLAERSFLGGVVIFSAEDELIQRTTKELAREHGLNLIGSLSKPVAVEELRELLDRFRAAESGPVVRSTEKRYERDELRRAIVNNDIFPHFQPQIDAVTGRCIGVEALARWQHADDGMVSPAVFVPLAEKTGLITALTETIYRQSVQTAVRLHTEYPDVRLSVNLSPLALQRTWLPDMLTEQADAYGVSPGRITLEVTESKIIDNLALSLEVLTRLRLRGFGLSIDDYGTGYASMQQLRRIPFTELKVDKSFVHTTEEDGATVAILESSIALGKRMNLTIVAEGVETEAEWDRVVGLGCNVVQGWLKAPAMPEAKLFQWLREQPEAAAQSHLVPPPRREARSPVVLVVDDSAFHRDATSKILVNLGVEAEVVPSGSAALERIAKGGISLALVDLQMPEMDGFEASVAIRNLGAAAVPVVGQSGSVDDESQAGAAAAGMVELIEKSFELEVLRSVLDRWLPTPEAESTAAEAESQSAEATQPVLDLSVLAAATGLDPETLRRMASQAINDIGDTAAELHRSAELGDLRLCRALAHRAKSSARAIGADRLHEVLASMASAGGQSSLETVRRSIRILDERLAEVQAGFSEMA